MCAAVGKHGQCLQTFKARNRIGYNKGFDIRLARPSLRWKSSQSSQQHFATTIFSGIQPTGVPHLGNYLGALREWVKIQDTATTDTKLIFSIVDLHALTVPQQGRQLRKWRKEAFATLIAVGLDPKRSTIFYQSAVRDNPRYIRCYFHAGYPADKLIRFITMLSYSGFLVL